MAYAQSIEAEANRLERGDTRLRHPIHQPVADPAVNTEDDGCLPSTRRFLATLLMPGLLHSVATSEQLVDSSGRAHRAEARRRLGAPVLLLTCQVLYKGSGVRCVAQAK